MYIIKDVIRSHVYPHGFCYHQILKTLLAKTDSFFTMKGKDNNTSWIVLAVVTFSLFLEVGLIKSLSVLLPDIKEQFATYTWVIGSSISIILAWGSIIGEYLTTMFVTFESMQYNSQAYMDPISVGL